MKLNEEDQRLLAGDFGAVAREAMEYQVEVARFYGIDEMVTIRQASAGMDYSMNGPYGLQVAEDFAARGGRFRCFTRTAFQIMDLYRWEALGSPAQEVEKQIRYRAAILKMGALPTYSNLPFQMPAFGEEVAWSGGNTTVLANSYFGARSNLEGPIGGLMAALTARVPRTGMRIPENRRGTVEVEVDVRLDGLVDWDALGYAIGLRLPESHHVPVFTGLPAIDSMGARQRFDSNITTRSSLMMYHIVGATPEARTREEAFGGRKAAETIRIGQADLAATYAALSRDHDAVDLVAFGGHHVELDEFPVLLSLMEGRKAHDGVRVWVFTGPQYKSILESLGYDAALRRFGAELIYGTSLMFMTPRHFAEHHGIRRVVTDSGKTAEYVRGFGMTPSLQPLERCVEAAVAGRISAWQPGARS